MTVVFQQAGVNQVAIKTKTCPVNDLMVGMYVSRLDVPWASTPFPLQGFYIENQNDIDQLRRFCREVYIDEVKSNIGGSGKGFSISPTERSTSSSSAHIKEVKAPRPRTAETTRGGNIGSDGATLRRGKEVYKIAKTVAQEIKTAKKIYSQLTKSIEEVMGALENSRTFEAKVVQKTAAKIVDSVIRNPDALAWLGRVQETDTHTYQHTIRMTIWGISFGRYLGLPRSELELLALALLLSSTGKTKLSPELFKSNLSPEERAEYKKHVQYSVEIIQSMPAIPANVIYVVEAYCERHNGSGYPAGLRGKRIPFLARVAGLVDYYDELLNPRDKTKALSSADAIAHLFKLRDVSFHGEMIEAFIQAMGVYPTGTLVELSNGEVGLILEQKRERRLKPRIAVVVDSEKHVLDKHYILDLDKEPKDKSGNPIRIIGSVPAHRFDVDLEEVHKAIYGKLSGWF